jgi:PD-(D/E)XK nuclease superfamily domain
MSGAKRRRARNKNTRRKSDELEVCCNSLQLIGFEKFENKQFKKLTTADRPGRYVVRDYPQQSLYGTAGKKEGFVWDGEKEWIIEAKVQDVSGSVDEKIPYIFEAFLISPILNWIIVYNGNYWAHHKRGIAVIQWLKCRAAQATPDGREFHVFSRAEFITFAQRRWGGVDRNQSAAAPSPAPAQNDMFGRPG